MKKTFLKSVYLKISDPIVLWLNEKDMACLMFLEMNGICPLSRLSAEYKDAVVSIVEMASGEPHKTLMKLIKKRV